MTPAEFRAAHPRPGAEPASKPSTSTPAPKPKVEVEAAQPRRAGEYAEPPAPPIVVAPAGMKEDLMQQDGRVADAPTEAAPEPVKDEEPAGFEPSLYETLTNGGILLDRVKRAYSSRTPPPPPHPDQRAARTLGVK